MSTVDRTMLMPASVLCALLGITVHVAAQPQSDARSDAGGSIEEIRELNAIETERLSAIDAEIARNGPLSAQLYEMYFALATHYRERDDPLLATAALEQAMHIQRVAHGLFSLEQIAAMRLLIDSARASGQFERATELDLQLMRIARQNLDDVRSAAILSEAADRQMAVYEQYLAGELPPVMSINFDSGPPGRNIDPNRLLGISNLRYARRNWSIAINVLLDAGMDTDSRLVELETSLIESYFIEASAADIRGRQEGLFRLGRTSYQRLLRYAIKTDDVDVATQAMIGLADWHLLFHRNATALQLYSDAWQAMRELGVPEERLEEIFNPEVPVVLPAFRPNPLARSTPDDGASRSPDAYLNVNLVMSRYGRSRLRDLNISPDPAKETVEDRIRRIVSRSRFRPLVIDGEAQHAAEFEFRYYDVDSGDT